MAGGTLRAEWVQEEQRDDTGKITKGKSKWFSPTRTWDKCMGREGSKTLGRRVRKRAREGAGVPAQGSQTGNLGNILSAAEEAERSAGSFSLLPNPRFGAQRLRPKPSLWPSSLEPAFMQTSLLSVGLVRPGLGIHARAEGLGSSLHPNSWCSWVGTGLVTTPKVCPLSLAPAAHPCPSSNPQQSLLSSVSELQAPRRCLTS